MRVSLVGIEFGSFALQLVQIVTGSVIGVAWSSIEGFRTVHACRLDRRTQISQAAQQISQAAEGCQACECI